MKPEKCPYCTDGQAGAGKDSCKLLIASYILAGLAMMLNIRLSYSSAPYALIRFKLPENLFSVFVRRMASALELWCLPSMLLGNIMELGLKGYYKSANYTSDWTIGGGNLKDPTSTIDTGKAGTKVYLTFDTSIIPNIDALITPRLLKFWIILCPSILAQWLNFLTYVILFFVYVIGGDQGHLTLFYFVIAISGVVFGINMVLVYAADWNYTPVYIVGENSFPIVTSFMHYISTLIFGNRRKWNSDFILVLIDIWVAIIISLAAAIVWTAAYGVYLDTEENDVITYNKGKVTAGPPGAATLNPADLTPADSITTITVTDKDGKSITYTQGTGPAATDTTILTIKKEGDAETTAYFTKGNGGPTPTPETEKGTIILNIKNGKTLTITPGTDKTVPFGHIFTETFDTSTPHWQIISPTLMVIVGMGLVYAIYPGIAPGMIVPFYLVDKIEMVLLIATFFPPVIVALLNRGQFGGSTKAYSPKTAYAGFGIGMGGWRIYTPLFDQPRDTEVNNSFWHAFDILIVIKITLAVIFIYSLHYRDSNISRYIINQPKMSTALSIVFYMCHEILLALGFAGVIGNNGGTYVVLPAQYVGALFMIFLAFYSEGYIIEYKSHDPAHWPTEGMTWWNSFCYWCKRARKITNHNLTSWFQRFSDIFSWLPYTLLYLIN